MLSGPLPTKNTNIRQIWIFDFPCSHVYEVAPPPPLSPHKTHTLLCGVVPGTSVACTSLFRVPRRPASQLRYHGERGSYQMRSLPLGHLWWVKTYEISPVAGEALRDLLALAGVGNRLAEARVLWGGNLLRATGWCSACDEAPGKAHSRRNIASNIKKIIAISVIRQKAIG